MLRHLHLKTFKSSWHIGLTHYQLPMPYTIYTMHLFLMALKDTAVFQHQYDAFKTTQWQLTNGKKVLRNLVHITSWLMFPLWKWRHGYRELVEELIVYTCIIKHNWQIKMFRSHRPLLKHMGKDRYICVCFNTGRKKSLHVKQDNCTANGHWRRKNCLWKWGTLSTTENWDQQLPGSIGRNRTTAA